MNRNTSHELEAHQLSQQCLRLAIVCLSQARAAGYLADYRDHELRLYDQLMTNCQRMADHINQL